jgi:hypothetical protein
MFHSSENESKMKKIVFDELDNSNGNVKEILNDIVNDLSKDENIIKFYNENKENKVNITIFIKHELKTNFKNFIEKSSENLNKKITNLIVKKRGLEFILNSKTKIKKIKKILILIQMIMKIIK